jgi:hypothetical protein
MNNGFVDVDTALADGSAAVMRLVTVLRIFALVVVFASIPGALLAQDAGLGPSKTSAVIDTFCISCHSGRGARGGVSLDRLDADKPGGAPEIWERVVRQLRARTMPTMTAPRPDSTTYQSAIAALTHGLDRARETTAAPLTDTQLAGRLAKLIWNAEPDQPLRDAAAGGRLRESQALHAQVRRMLSDTKANALVRGFFEPWLLINQVTTLKRDETLFPEFDDELRAALQQETALFIGSQLRDDRNSLELWTANYTFLNERLARHYGVPNVYGPDFRRVTWPGTERAGLLAQGSILAVTARAYPSYPVDIPTTSPAMRAKWILTRFLGVDPPATVQGVPPEDFPFEKHTPLVKQSKTFPANPCLACHRSFFPLSYGLENFDVLGRWRTHDGTGPIDASGAMVDGTTFNGPVELRRALLELQDAFLSTLTERLMAYVAGGTAAIEQPTPASRMPAVRAALNEAGAHNYSWSSLIAAVVKRP